MSSTPLCPLVFVSGKSYPVSFPLGSLVGSCSCGWVIPVSPSQSNPGKNNRVSVNVEMDGESRRADGTDARGSSLLPQEPRSPVQAWDRRCGRAVLCVALGSRGHFGSLSFHCL